MTGNVMTNEFIAFVLYEWPGADDVPFFCVGVSVGRAEHLLAGPFQTKAAACAWIEMQPTIGLAAVTRTLALPRHPPNRSVAFFGLTKRRKAAETANGE